MKAKSDNAESTFTTSTADEILRSYNWIGT